MAAVGHRHSHLHRGAQLDLDTRETQSLSAETLLPSGEEPSVTLSCQPLVTNSISKRGSRIQVTRRNHADCSDRKTTAVPTSRTMRDTNVSNISGQGQYAMSYTPYTQTGISAAEKQVQDIADWAHAAQWELVELIVVGNEAIKNGYCDPPELAAFIKTAKATFKASGYRGRVTTAETFNVWQSHGASYLCEAVDLIGANIHPYFDHNVAAPKAGEFVASQLEELRKICPDQDVLNLETGWPNAGEPNGAAVPGKEEQIAAIDSIVNEVGSQSVFFSYGDDWWKEPGPHNVEQHWGCAGVFTSRGKQQ
ncbi:hypothetical protein E8E15_001286 [Penicillium rubens]|nr:hypothetical protein E8E15_001286 [Penicillium rubens]